MTDQVLIEHGSLRLAALRAGNPRDPAIVLLHGWPLTKAIWRPTIEPLAQEHHVLAFDLPGIGGSAASNAPALKSEIAELLIGAAESAGARDIVVAGVDVGGMIAFAAARDFGDRIRGAVVMNTVIPGLDPWEKVLTDEHVWHFALHQVPNLPETLVAGRERPYFDFFLDVLNARPQLIDNDMREEFVAAYSSPQSLKAGFDWYRAMPEDAKRNGQHKVIETPILYLRGGADPRPIEPYLEGIRAAGAKRVIGKVIEGSGEILSLEAPDTLISCLKEFAASLTPVHS
jgi:pimeloyl-ACP methyl ester carboxylesterase